MTIRRRGYTLLEMLVVLSLIIIVTSIVVVEHDSLKQKIRADGVVSTLYQAILYARSSAVRYNSVVTLCPFVKEEQGCGREWSNELLIFRDDYGDGVLHRKSEIIRFISLGNRFGYIVWKNFRKKRYLQFLPYGVTNSLNGTFIYCPNSGDARYARAVFINKNGVCRFSVDRDHDSIQETSSGEPLACG